MKKLIFLVLGLTVFSSFVFSQATVVSVSGKVEVQRGGKWVLLKAGDEVSQGELLNTGFKSEAVIKYQGSVMKMGPMTRLTLEKLSSGKNKDSVSAYLRSGSLRSNVSHAGKKTQQTTRSAVAVASVRGTDYFMTSSGLIQVFEGAVDVLSAAKFNPADFGIEFPADGKKGATPEQVAAFEDRAPLDGLSNPNTAPGDVNPFIPDSILVPAGYSVDFFGNEQTQVQTLNETFSSYEKFTSQFNSQDDSENSDPLNTPVDVQPVSNSEKGTLSISVEISE